jgi:glutamate synthase domain-containing protein 2
MPTADTSPPTSLTVLVDEVRSFKDERPTLVARSSQEARTLLEGLGDRRIDHLWLDHDLGGEGTIRPVIDLLVRLAHTGSPLDVGLVNVHTANVGAGHWMRLELAAAGYAVVRSYSLGMWTRDA